MSDNWKFARANEKSAVQIIRGRTIAQVTVEDSHVEFVFTDGSRLEVGCYVNSRGCSDVAELSFDTEIVK